MVRPNTATLCALAAVAFVTACVAHEVVGHAGTCLVTGGAVQVLSSSLFRCAPPRALVDAGGPVASLLVAALATVAIQRSGNGAPRAFFALLLGIAGFWIAGELVSSAATNTGDLAFVLRAALPRPYGPWRVATGAVGAVLYVAVIRRAGRDLPRGWPLVAAYLTAGAVACISTLFFTTDHVRALREGALESLGASVGLLYLAFRSAPELETSAEHGAPPYNRPAILLSVSVVVLFWLSLGRGMVRG